MEQNVVNITHDVDILFKNLKSNTYYYVEVKYNDDHDTGKFVDINRKFLKTYAYNLTGAYNLTLIVIRNNFRTDNLIYIRQLSAQNPDLT